MCKKLVSVALATYNGEEYIEEFLESVLSQSYKNIELIIYDDCSTDSTVAILKKIASKEPRICFYQQKSNIGFVKNFESVLTKCSGDYIALADQDDIWEKNKIELLMKNIEDFDLIHSDALLIDAKGEIFSNSYTNSSNKLVYPEKLEDIIVNNPVTGCTTLVSQSLLVSALPFPKNILVHDQWLACLAITGRGIKYLDEPLIRYRQHDKNQIGAKSKKSILYKLRNISIINKKNEFGLLNLIEELLKISKKDKINLKALKKYYTHILDDKWLYPLLFRLKRWDLFNKNQSFFKRLILLLQVFK
ncbi:glycosyltransferase family 2 protein [Vibrio cyclitrophicus]